MQNLVTFLFSIARVLFLSLLLVCRPVSEKTNEKVVRNSAEPIFFRKMIWKHFPNSSICINYQNKQTKFYKSPIGKGKTEVVRKMGLGKAEFSLTPEECDVLHYFSGSEFYKYH